MPEGLFDHTPMILNVFAERRRGRVQFKYFKMWSSATNFHSGIRECFESRVNGTPMFRVVQCLKKVIYVLKDLNK